MADPDPDSEKKADTDSDPGKKIWIRNTVFMDLDPESGESLIHQNYPDPKHWLEGVLHYKVSVKCLVSLS